MVCWSTRKLHRTPSLLRPRAKPFPRRTMSKDSEGGKQRLGLDAVWSFLLHLWGTARCAERDLRRKVRHGDKITCNNTAGTETLHFWFAQKHKRCHNRFCSFTRKTQIEGFFLVFQLTDSNDTQFFFFIRASLAVYDVLRDLLVDLLDRRPGGRGSTAAEDKSNHT